MEINLVSIIIILLIIGTVYMTYNKVTHVEQNITQTLQQPILQQQLLNKPIKQKLKPAIKKNKRKHKKKVKFDLPPVDNVVFLDVGTDDEYYGKIVIKLFDGVVPKTAENFKMLCKTKKYFNTPFHRIIEDFMIQGGDYTRGDGTGGESIYGKKFPDENFEIRHSGPYLLSMANSGPNTNGSQFFITTSATPHLDGKHVVFGKVIDGFKIVDKLNGIEVGPRDRPVENIKILNCGIFESNRDF